jgi:cytochrome c-type biogenesis protein CcmE
MANVDDELREALNESESTAQAEPAPVAVPVAPSARKTRRSVGLLLALLAMAGAILALVFTSFEGSAIYSRKVDEVTADRSKVAGRNLRVEGTLKRCTLVKRDDPCEFRFTMRGAKSELPVHYSRCTVPDTFQDVPGMVVDVTAEGTLDPAGHFEASTIMAKCPSKYEMKERALKGEAAPHLDPMLNKPCM